MNNVKLPYIDWFATPIKDSINSVFKGINEGVEALDIFKKYKKMHFKVLREEIGYIKILGMQQPIPLRTIYSKTYVSETIQRRLYSIIYGDDKIVIDPSKLDRRLSSKTAGHKYIENHKQVVVLGGPGSGKTTFLRFLGLTYLDKNLFDKSELKTSKFPIYINLPAMCKKKYKTATIETFISGKLAGLTDSYAQNFINRILKNGLATVLLDSLDEVPINHRDRIFTEIQDFSNQYNNCKVIVTCRTADYDQSFQNFFEVEILKLTQNAINKFIKGWFENKPELGEKLIKKISSHDDISSLIETPLLLSLLCIQYYEELDLPAMKTDLYRSCFNTLLIHWDAGRGFRRKTKYSKLTDIKKLNLFGNIAGRFFNDKKVSYVFSESALLEEMAFYCNKLGIPKDQIKGVLKEIESHHGILERHSKNYYQFSHPSFQEYFKAKDLLNKRTDLIEIRNNISDDNWHSVVEFFVSMSPDPILIINLLKKKSDFANLKNYPPMVPRLNILKLLYRCMVSRPTISQDVHNGILEHLVDSQVHIYNLFAQNNAYPLGQLLPDSIFQTVYYLNYRRDTLTDPTKKLSLLMNDILKLPSRKYSEKVVEKIKTIGMPHDFYDARFATILGLLLPISMYQKNEVKKWLKRLQPLVKTPSIITTFENSLEILDRYY